ncbi:MAG TPA: hypothetical protein VHY84_23160 [Bryobacteraceae bacterium]|jgi:uncharacterized membrane protein|nr:hypothetical protein [Bryobacteraceae bacterium]
MKIPAHDLRAKARKEVQSRWPALIASLATGVLFYAIPETLTIGPGWLLFVIIVALTIPTTLTHKAQRVDLNDIFAYSTLTIITLAVLSSLVLLIMRLPAHKETPTELLRAAAALWVANVLVFASWYWRLDGGGPNERDKRGIHTDGAFLFPQMIMDPELRHQMGEENWSPGFVDYLFLAFNTSTAFSPTDVPVLSRWAKVMMIVQSLISLGTVVLLAARAVNIL